MTKKRYKLLLQNESCYQRILLYFTYSYYEKIEKVPQILACSMVCAMVMKRLIVRRNLSYYTCLVSLQNIKSKLHSCCYIVKLTEKWMNNILKLLYYVGNIVYKIRLLKFNWTKWSMWCKKKLKNVVGK